MLNENPPIYEMSLMVQEDDLDAMNHVNNVRYLQWVQDAAEAHWQNVGNPEMLEKYAWVVINHFIEYKKPAVLGDEILIKTHVHENTGPKSNRLVRIYRAKDEVLLAQASTWWCLLDAKTSRPIRVTQELIDTFC